MPDYIPAMDSLWTSWLSAFTQFCVANQAALGLTVGEVAELGTADTDWATRYATHLAAIATAESARGAKDVSRDEAETIARRIAQKIYATAGVTEEQLLAAGLNVRDTTRTPLSGDIVLAEPSPILLADFSQRGQCTIHWGRNPENERNNAKPQGIMGVRIYYHVGALPVAPGDWELLVADTNSPYIHVLQEVPPQTISYRAQWFDRMQRVGPYGDPIEVTVSA